MATLSYFGGVIRILSLTDEYAQLIFLFFGVTTVFFSFVMLAYMPDSPMEAKFLDDHDRLVAIERLRANQMGSATREWRNEHLREAIFDFKTWLWFALMLAISIPSGGINTFGPLIISTFGFDKFQTTLFNMPYGVIQGIAILGGSYVATRWKRKGIIIAWLCCPVILGYLIMLALPHNAGNQVSLLFGYYLMSVYPGICKSLRITTIRDATHLLTSCHSTTALFMVNTKHRR